MWAASGHGPQGLWTIARERVAGAVLVYPYTLDVAAEAAAMHFAAPAGERRGAAARAAARRTCRARRDIDEILAFLQAIR
ncbi:MAG TPA: hypothetical protein VLT45_01110 [Kofleriaceae bacterium]|nr:hypothetical protein [Kofleriaceae bacterium]